MLIGLFFLPFEYALVSYKASPVLAQENLQDSLRSTANDLREQIRSSVQDPRETIREQPCSDDPRSTCARPIPTHRPSPTPPPSGSPQPSPSPTPPPSPSPTPQPSPSPGNGGTGGNGGDNDEVCTHNCEGTQVSDNGGIAPQVLGLSYTGSGKW